MFKIKLFFIIFISSKLLSQELPPIQSFMMDDYNASGQNWMISQSSNGDIFFANNDGLLVYNGNKWNSYSSTSNTIVRSVNSINDIVYTGENSDFGFWIKQKNGSYIYTSIPNKYEFELFEDEEFWNILEFKNWIVFQSLDRFIFFDPISEVISSIRPKGGVFKSFIIDNNLFFSINGQGIFKIDGGNYIPYNTNGIFTKNNIINVFKSGNSLLALTQYSGFYNILPNNKVLKWYSYLNDLDQLNVYSSIMNMDGSFSIGTVKKGLIKLDENGNLIETLNKRNSIINNTVLSVYEDDNYNLWLGLDNGISVVNYNSPFKIFEDYEGVLGTVYAFIEYNNFTYVGTNQGLYFKRNFSNNDFSLIEGTTGQVWSLKKINNELFCGHDNGTYIIDNEKAFKVPGTEGSWNFLEGKTKDIIFEGNYYGINVLKKDSKGWRIRNSLSGFDLSTRFFELTDDNTIIVVHGYKGVYKLELAPYFENLKSVKRDTLSIAGNPSLAYFNDKIYYKNKNGMYFFDEQNDTFIIDTLLSKAANPTGLIRADNDKLWIFSENEVFYAYNDDVSNEVNLNSVLIPNKLKRTVFENISSNQEDINIFGTNDGYFSLDLKSYKLSNNNFSIDNIMVNSIDSEPNMIDVDSNFILDYQTNNISFNYSVKNYQVFEKNEFQYRLIGYNDSWSNWTEESTISYNNLMYGRYTFELRTKNGNLINPEKKSISFQVARPWYFSNFMFINYSLFAGLILFFTNRYTRRYYVWKEKRLEKINKRKLEIKEIERKKNIASIENEKLQQDIENKNRELAVSTMSMIKKNQFLNKIKNDLKKIESDHLVKKVIKTIDKNLSNEDDWKFFQEAFNNADSEFLKKIKSVHNELTKNDLKLCAYLRLNLSSKDIAPLLNISVRSVEIKRYRLRKKMKLSHNEGLTEYILSI